MITKIVISVVGGVVLTAVTEDIQVGIAGAVFGFVAMCLPNLYTSLRSPI